MAKNRENVGLAKKESTIFYWEWHRNIMRKLSYQERGVLFSAIFDYDMDDEQEEIIEIIRQDRTLDLLFDTLKPSLDRNREKYRESCIANGIIANKRDYPGISEEEARRMYFENHPEMNDCQRALTNATDSDNVSGSDNVSVSENGSGSNIEGVNEGVIYSEKVKEKDARENHKGKHSFRNDIVSYCNHNNIDMGFLSDDDLKKLDYNDDWTNDLENMYCRHYGHYPQPFH